MTGRVDDAKKLELIATARQLLQDEYVRKNTEKQVAWKIANQNAWKSGNVTIPYPPFVSNITFNQTISNTPYPNEQDVVLKALELYNQLVATYPEEDTIEVSEEVTIGTVEEPVEILKPAVEETPELIKEKIEPQTQEIYKIYQDVKIEETPVIPQPAEELKKRYQPERILSSVLKKLKDIRETND